jgi:hypothetical protein
LLARSTLARPRSVPLCSAIGFAGCRFSYSLWSSRRLFLSELPRSPAITPSLPVRPYVAVFTSLYHCGLVSILLWYLDRARLNSNETYCHPLRQMKIVTLARQDHRSPSSSTPSPKPWRHSGAGHASPA